MSNFWMVRFFKTESEPKFGFPHITSDDAVLRVDLSCSQSSKVMTAVVDQKTYLEELNRHLT